MVRSKKDYVFKMKCVVERHEFFENLESHYGFNFKVPIIVLPHFYNTKYHCYRGATTCNVKYPSPSFHYFKNLLKETDTKVQWCKDK